MLRSLVPLRTLSRHIHTSVKSDAAASTHAKKRPLSPHLSIYKFGDNMITSVLFRGTGIAMTAGFFGLAVCSLSSKKFPEHVKTLQQYPLINGTIKFFVPFTLGYHFAGGLRHLSWDNAIGNNVKSATKSGYVAMAFAVACGLYGAFTEYPKEE